MGQSLVVGATGVVGGYILHHLAGAGEYPLALSRRPHSSTGDARWFQGELSSLHTLELPPIDTLYCTANIGPLAQALRCLEQPSLKRVIVFTTTSILTKIDSEIETERNTLRQLADAERDLIDVCRDLGIGYTILRPTLIYAEGRDVNVTRLAQFISRFGFVPLAGEGAGLRQPVHAEDLAIGALAAAKSDLAMNKIYSLSGVDTFPYREMVGRIFDSMHRPRRTVAVPLSIWRLAFKVAGRFFPHSNASMGARMNKDMTFDCSAAISDFGWNPRAFRPQFDQPKSSATMGDS